MQYYQPTNSNFNGTFTFNGKLTNDGIGDVLLGFPSSTSIKVGTVTNHLYDTNYGGYVQNDWKLLPSLTLNLGMRYEIQGAPYEEYGQMTNFDPGVGQVLLGGVSTLPNWQSIVAAAGLTGLVGLGSDHGLPSALVHTNYDNFAPRVGFAWRPFKNNKTVVHSGYGVFYTGSRLSAMRTDLAGGFPFSLSQPFTGSTTNPSLITLANSFPSSLAKTSGTTTATGWEVNAPSPYLQSWNFTIEREVGKGVAVEVGYAGSKGTHLGRKFAAKNKFEGVDPTGYFFPGYPAVPKPSYVEELKKRAADLGLGISGTGVQNHGDFLQTGEELMTLIKAVGSDWCGPIVDTGYFKTPDLYVDIALVAPHALNWQSNRAL